MKKDATALDLVPLGEVLDSPEPLRLRIGSPRYAWWQRALKRAFDIAFSASVLLIGSPVFLVISLLVKASSPGPVLFRQTRLGVDGEPFDFYKFRSMRHNNDDQAHREFCADFIRGQQDEPVGDDQVFKMVADPRITKIGGFLRRTSLDELPQFWNVLKGEMSVVGPRPPIAYEFEHYEDWHKDRLKVKPGLTGLWQVSGRSQVGFDEMVMLDLHYISQWSFLLDLRIIARTIPVMVRGDGAY